MHNKIIIDASVALKWFLTEQEESVEEARQLLKQSTYKEVLLIAPDFLIVEVLNIISQKRKQKRTPLEKIYKKLVTTNVQFVPMTSCLSQLPGVIEQYAVTAYDALYIILAEQDKLFLITEDKKLLNTYNRAMNLVQWSRGV